MTASPDWIEDLPGAVVALKRGPRPLASVLSTLADVEVTPGELSDYLAQANHASAGVPQLQQALARWDEDDTETFAASTPSTTQRRIEIYERLKLPSEARAALDALCPAATSRATVISTRFEPWYDPASLDHDMYWTHYIDYLARKGWESPSLMSLQQSSYQVVRRLSDPSRAEAKQTKGLVVGYVQSGKTANFTGVIARAIDAGYRLIIVLTGTIEILRAQTQRRLDMELIGRENVLAGRSEADAGLHEYAQDEDWIGRRFVEHGRALDYEPRIRRVTTLAKDYKSLPEALTRLRFERPHRNLPLNAPQNLSSVDAYVAVVKKNVAPLRSLIEDMRPLQETLDELPVLIIDDESDQASVDTTRPTDVDEAGRRKRKAINAKIAELLELCKRAQYVGYTATPFANVFINPDDATDLFPSDFIVSLPRPDGYMGVQEFHDVGRDPDEVEETPDDSKRVAHVRPLTGDGSDQASRRRQLASAIDAFVLTGAVKKYREANLDQRRRRALRHHTMIVHESMYTKAAGVAKQDVLDLWRSGRFTGANGAARLRELYENDIRPVSMALGADQPNPASFEELKPYIGLAVAAITEGGEDPVVVVNSDKDLTAGQKPLDFQHDDVWKILIGGTQLSRGFTVEGLTVSYFRRRSGQADTLMQAGRWFGFRPGYADLVRLFIRRDKVVDDHGDLVDDPTIPPHKRIDLYETFEALMLDEQDFRDELHRYSGFDGAGHPVLEPRAVPPLVTQRRTDVRPTAPSKMWNAKILERAPIGVTEDHYFLPAPDNADAVHNLRHVGAPLVEIASQHPGVSLEYSLPAPRAGGTEKVGTFTANVGTIDAPAMVELLRRLNLVGGGRNRMDATLAYFDRVVADGFIDDWAVVWPQTAGQTARTVRLGKTSIDAQVVERTARPRGDYPGSENRHRRALPAVTRGVPGILSASDKRAALLLYLSSATTAPKGRLRVEDGLVTTMVSLYLPDTPDLQRRGPVKWSVRVGGNHENDLVVDDSRA